MFNIDRKKDLVKMENGEYVSLGKVETALSHCPIVESVCVYADGGKPYTIALIVPRAKELSALARSLNLNPDDLELLCNNPAVANSVLQSIETTAKHGMCYTTLSRKHRRTITNEFVTFNLLLHYFLATEYGK